MALTRGDVNVFYINLDYDVKSATCACVSACKSRGSIAKTWRGVPAAGQTSAKSNRRLSNQDRTGAVNPIGDTPPMAKPVCVRIWAASARVRSAPTRAAARVTSTCRPPAVMNKTTSSGLVAKMMDFAIWSIWQPMAAAASAAVRVPSAISDGVMSNPAPANARVTRFRLLLMGCLVAQAWHHVQRLTKGQPVEMVAP